MMVTNEELAQAWREGAATMSKHGRLMPDGRTRVLPFKDGRAWPNPYEDPDQAERVDRLVRALYIADNPGHEEWAQEAWADMSFPADDVSAEAFEYLSRAKAVLAVVRAHLTDEATVRVAACAAYSRGEPELVADFPNLGPITDDYVSDTRAALAAALDQEEQK